MLLINQLRKQKDVDEDVKPGRVERQKERKIGKLRNENTVEETEDEKSSNDRSRDKSSRIAKEYVLQRVKLEMGRARHNIFFHNNKDYGDVGLEK